MSKNSSALPAFSFNWVGGDIRGLSKLAGTLYQIAAKSAEPVSVLSNTVDRLVSESHDATWKGSAADNFRRNFGQDITDIDWLTSRNNAIADIVDELAVRLAKLEAWLEGQAEKGRALGFLSIDGDGKVGLPKGTAEPSLRHFLRQFNQNRTEAMSAAKAARKRAAAKLASEYRAVSVGLNNYRDNHKNLLSENEIKSLSSSIDKLNSNFSAADHRLEGSNLHWGAAVEGAWKGAAEVGGVMGLFGIETGPFDIPITVVGATVGGVGGFFEGLITGHALFER
jgi:hypothetical protein